MRTWPRGIEERLEHQGKSIRAVDADGFCAHADLSVERRVGAADGNGAARIIDADYDGDRK